MLLVFFTLPYLTERQGQERVFYRGQGQAQSEEVMQKADNLASPLGGALSRADLVEGGQVCPMSDKSWWLWRP